MAVNKRLLQGAAAAGGLVPSEHFGVVLYEGDGSTSHSINGGKFGAGAYFNGTTSEVTTSNMTGLDSTTISLSAWVYFNAVGVENTILSRFGGCGNHSCYQIILRTTSSNVWSFATYNGTGSGDSLTSTATVSTGQWYHVVAIADGTSKKIYVNGQQIASSTVAFSVNTSSGEGLNIGGRGDFAASSTSRMNGKIDQVRLFSKALSSSEVSTLYAETDPESLDPLSEDTTDTLQVLGDSSCIATYRFENNEDDLSGNYDGTGTEIQYAAGRYGQAAVFNGTSSFINTGISNTTIPVSSNFSVSAWVNTNSSSGFFIAEGNFNSWNTAGFGLGIISGNRVELSFGNVAPSGGPQVQSSALAADTWYHIVGTVDIGNVLTLYVNGVSVGTDTITSSNRTTVSGGFNIGADAGGYDYTGKLDQVRFFNKALSASEVTTLYNENSLVASYRFEGNANDDMRAYDGTASNVTYEYGLNFTPDFIWTKNRSSAHDHNLTDSTRGVQKGLNPNTTAVEGNQAPYGVTSFDTGGFTVSDNSGGGAGVNGTGFDYVAWCLKANGGTTSSNTDGNITSTVQVNQDAGFSIVSLTIPNANTQSVGHGLSQAPEMIIMKATDSAEGWLTYHSSVGLNKYLFLNSTAAEASYTGIWSNVNSSTFTTVYHDAIGSPTRNVIAYCFHSVEGFSKFGTYTGNGSTTGPIVETGFEPAMVILKRTDTADSWYIYDNKRDLTNPKYHLILPDTNNSEFVNQTTYALDFLSNGFQIKNTAIANSSGGTYIYMAFAADPDTEAPTVAKSFSTVAYTGNSSTNEIDGLGFQPNFVWLKSRNHSGGNSHVLLDSIRGTNKVLISNSNGATWTTTDVFTSFDSDGFTLPSNTGTQTNQSGYNYVAWAWKADDNEPTINTEGSIDSIVSANANAGFSIVKFTGNGTQGASVGHGLSSAPSLIIMKDLSATNHWVVGNSESGWTKAMHLDLTNADNASNLYWDDTAPTSTVFSLGHHITAYNVSGNEYIAYCFHSVSGYSKIGSYTGTGSEQLINTGFAVDFVLIKSTTTAQNWMLYDNVRGDSKYLIADSSGAEGSPASNLCTFESNGFKVYSSNSENQSGQTYIYMAFKIN